MSDEIDRLRKEIDALDDSLADLVGRRAGLARRIGELKGGTAVYRPEREAAILRRVASRTHGPLSGARVAAVFREVISVCRGAEAALRVAYLGPAGTFSEQAVLRHFGSAVEGLPCASIDEVFRAVETGSADFAVVPAENSAEGAIGRTLDLLLTTPKRICGEVVLRIHQNLMARDADAPVTRVYSHAQSLAQCHRWLAQNLPNVERVPVSSNAEAARLAANEPGTCAIGPAIAAERYGLALRATDIEDDATNRTRFLVLGDLDVAASGHDGTSIVLSAPNRPGAVHALLTPLANHGVSMSRLESRPTRVGQWEYYFYVDLNGHRDAPSVAAALKELSELAPFLKILGSYPLAPV